MAKSNNLSDFTKGIADAIRVKKGTTGLINPQNFETEIVNLPDKSDVLAKIIDRSIEKITSDDLKDVTMIGDSVFRECTKLISVQMPDNIVSIFSNVFSGCTSLKNVRISNKIEDIPFNAFSGCTSLTNITIPDSVYLISENAFTRCYNITNMVIGNGIETIEARALNIGNADSKVTITIKATTPPDIQSNTFNDIDTINKIIVPKGSGSAYKTATNWSTYASLIEEDE